jgi:PKD repeat protein
MFAVYKNNCNMNSCKNTLAIAALLVTSALTAQIANQSMSLVVAQNSLDPFAGPAAVTLYFTQDATDSIDFYDMNTIGMPNRFSVQPYTKSSTGESMEAIDSRPLADRYTSVPLGFRTADSASLKLILSWRSDPSNDSSTRPTYVWIKETASGIIFPLSATDTLTLNVAADTTDAAPYQLCYGPAIDKQVTNTTCSSFSDGTITVTNPNNNNWKVCLYQGTTLLNATLMNQPTSIFQSLAPGNYTVVSFIDHHAIDSSAVTVGSPTPILPTFTSSTTSAWINDTIAFTNATSGGLSFTWDFGDGNFANSLDASHTYSAGGTYTVTLTAMAVAGCQESVSDIISINGTPMRQNLAPAHGFQTGGDPTGPNDPSNPVARQSQDSNTITLGNSIEKISIAQSSPELLTIELLSLDGRTISSTQSSDSRFDISVPAQGIYLVRITSGSQIIDCKKVFVGN